MKERARRAEQEERFRVDGAVKARERIRGEKPQRRTRSEERGCRCPERRCPRPRRDLHRQMLVDRTLSDEHVTDENDRDCRREQAIWRREREPPVADANPETA